MSDPYFIVLHYPLTYLHILSLVKKAESHELLYAQWPPEVVRPWPLYVTHAISAAMVMQKCLNSPCAANVT